MKTKIILCLFFCLFCTLTYGQKKVKTIKQTEYFPETNIIQYSYQVAADDRKSKEGKFTEYYEDKKKKRKKAVGSYHQNAKTGTWSYYAKTGYLKAEMTYIAGQLEGPTKRYFKDGTIHQKGHYKAGKKDGKWDVFHPDGFLDNEGEWKAGHKHGTWTYYYHTGQPNFVINYKEGKKHGDYSYFYKNGQLTHKKTYVENEMVSDIVQVYYENGTVALIKSYNHDSKEEKEQYFDTSGKAIAKDDPLLGSEVLIWLEAMPEFAGGNTNLFKFLGQIIHYPFDAKVDNIEGTVYVGFIVDEMGYVQDEHVKRGVYPSINEEALRIIRAMPRWEPGLQKAKPVKVAYTLPIRFILN